MQETARMASVVSSTLLARRRLTRVVKTEQMAGPPDRTRLCSIEPKAVNYLFKASTRAFSAAAAASAFTLLASNWA